MSDVVVLIDRQQGGQSRLAADNLKLHAAFTLSYILEVPPPTVSAPRAPLTKHHVRTIIARPVTIKRKKN